MSILVNKNSRIITQGMTGKTGQFHTRLCRDYGFGKECFVGGVNPKKPDKSGKVCRFSDPLKRPKKRPVQTFP